MYSETKKGTDISHSEDHDDTDFPTAPVSNTIHCTCSLRSSDPFPITFLYQLFVGGQGGQLKLQITDTSPRMRV